VGRILDMKIIDRKYLELIQCTRS